MHQRSAAVLVSHEIVAGSVSEELRLLEAVQPAPEVRPDAELESFEQSYDHGVCRLRDRDLRGLASTRGDFALPCHAQHRRGVTSSHRHLTAYLLKRPGIECVIDDEVVDHVKHGFVAIGCDGNEEDLRFAESLMVNGVHGLRQRLARPALEHERERRPAARPAGERGHLDEFGGERVSNAEELPAQRLEVGDGERVETGAWLGS